MEKRARRFPNMLLVIGVLLFLLGGLLLLWTFGYLRNGGGLWPLIFILLGLFVLYLVVFRGRAEVYVFPGMLMALGGLYFLLGTSFMPWHDLIRIWPVFMAITGASIIPYAFMKQGYARVVLLVPSIAIVFLAGVFLPFSLRVVSVRFVRFVSVWWPVLVVILGIGFLVAHFVRLGRKEDMGTDDIEDEDDNEDDERSLV
jgi:hypothetical protein